MRFGEDPLSKHDPWSIVGRSGGRPKPSGQLSAIEPVLPANFRFGQPPPPEFELKLKNSFAKLSDVHHAGVNMCESSMCEPSVCNSNNNDTTLSAVLQRGNDIINQGEVLLNQMRNPLGGINFLERPPQ